MKEQLITQIHKAHIKDGEGGFESTNPNKIADYWMKISVGGGYEEATSYGVSVEQILKAISDVEINRVNPKQKPLFEYNNRYYELRDSRPLRDKFLLTLVEV